MIVNMRQLALLFFGFIVVVPTFLVSIVIIIAIRLNVITTLEGTKFILWTFLALFAFYLLPIVKVIPEIVTSKRLIEII